MPPQVAVIVLNWNRRDDTLRCLASLSRSSYPELTTILVDNASDDGTVEAARERFPHLRIIENHANLGFAAGNNVGIQAALDAGCDYVMLLNNDTIVAPDAIGLMVQCIEHDATIGIVAPAIPYLSRPEVVWSAGGNIDWRVGEPESRYFETPLSALPAEPYQVDHVTGCCMLVRSSTIRLAGQLDPRFFMYFEETEWCVRIANAGYRIMVEPRALVWHAIEPKDQTGSPLIAYYMTRNRLLFLRATHAPLWTLIRTLLWQIRTLGSLFVRPHSRERARGRIPMMRAMRDFLLGRYGSFPIQKGDT